MSTTTVIILAGGRSRRMGHDKSSLAWKAGTILDAVIDAAIGVTDNVFVVVDQPDRLAAELAAARGVRTIADLLTNSGPIGGIHAGLRAAIDAPPAGSTASGVETLHRTCVTCPCDAPFVSTAILQHLADLLERTGSTVVAPVTDAGVQPLIAAWSTRAIPYIEQFQNRGGRSLRELLELIPDVRLLPAHQLSSDGSPHRDPFTNINSPDDYRQARIVLTRNPLETE